MAEIGGAPGVSQEQVAAMIAPYALQSSVPTPASSAPPAVAVTSVNGSDLTQYARADHTHASKTRRMVQAIPAASTYVWTYPTPFAAGVIPMVNAIAQVPVGTTDLYNLQVVGTPGNASCTFQINRVSSGLLGVLLGALSINPTPSAITLHMWAVES
jgi:hypothetical protein